MPCQSGSIVCKMVATVKKRFVHSLHERKNSFDKLLEINHLLVALGEKPNAS